jgi:hypothetical protein
VYAGVYVKIAIVRIKLINIKIFPLAKLPKDIFCSLIDLYRD